MPTSMQIAHTSVPNRSGWIRCLFVVAIITSSNMRAVFAAGDPAAGDPARSMLDVNLTTLSLEELANFEITSVSKRPEPLNNAAASVFVITQEDIRRSGATSLPEALRLAPNLQVAQVSASNFAITSRGMNGSNSSAPNKLLVLIDGRSVYTPLFSGVFWDVQDVMLEDVERIEVISGPGGTLWGVNAVNGVINVITRSAQHTQGNLVVGNAGRLGGDVSFRHGGTLGADGTYRIYGKHIDRDNTRKENGESVDDAWRRSQLGFRADWARANNKWMVQGNLYDGAIGQPEPGSIAISGVNLALDTIPVSGLNLTTRWDHRLPDASDLSLQLYYDRTKRTVPPTFSESLDIVDVQFQHTLRPIGIHAPVWGVNYRYSMDRTATSPVFAFLPEKVNQKWTSLFVQDEMSLRDDLRIVLGARVERNPYTGNEFLPNARLAWKFSPDHLLWGAASRAVRAPSRLDRDPFIPSTPPFLLAGGPDTRSEVAKVYEVGYRGQLTPRFSASFTAFRTDYDHLRTQEIAPSRTFVVFASEMEGRARGVEMWGSYQATRAWRLSAGYTRLDTQLQIKPGSNDVNAPNAAGRDPTHTLMIRSSLDLPHQSELDASIRHVSALANPTVPSYTAVDLRLGWRPHRNLELSLIGKNLLGGGHAEYGDAATRSFFERSWFIKAAWTF